MVCIMTMQAQREFLKENRERLLKSEHRYILIRTQEIGEYDTLEQVYEACPELKPGGSPRFRTPPLLIDTEKEKNTRSYRLEQLDEKEAQTRKCRDRLDHELIELSEKRKALEAEPD